MNDVGKAKSVTGYTTLIASNTRPPEGVPIAALEEIRIRFEISRTQGLQTGRKPKAPRTKACNDSEDWDMLDISDDGSRPIGHSQPSLGIHIPSQWRHIEERDMGLYSVLQNVCENMLHGIVIHESQLNSFSPNPAVIQSRVDLSTIQRKRNSSDGHSSLPRFDPMSAVKLVDAALRALICDYDVTASAGIEVERDSTRQKLAAISPALFSPGYLQVRS